MSTPKYTVFLLLLLSSVLSYWLLLSSDSWQQISVWVWREFGQGNYSLQSIINLNINPEPMSIEDRPIKLGEDDFFIHLQTMLPNIPILHWWTNKNKKVSEDCWKIPNILDLHYSNKYWQVKESSNGTFYLYAAYLDVRPGGSDSVRILGMIDRIRPEVKTFCKLWFKNSVRSTCTKQCDRIQVHLGKNLGKLSPRISVPLPDLLPPPPVPH